MRLTALASILIGFAAASCKGSGDSTQGKPKAEGPIPECVSLQAKIEKLLTCDKLADGNKAQLTGAAEAAMSRAAKVASFPADGRDEFRRQVAESCKSDEDRYSKSMAELGCP